METSIYKPKWFDLFTEREQQELRFAHVYATEFRHGTSGHIEYMLLHKLASLIDAFELGKASQESQIDRLRGERDEALGLLQAWKGE